MNRKSFRQWLWVMAALMIAAVGLYASTGYAACPAGIAKEQCFCQGSEKKICSDGSVWTPMSYECQSLDCSTPSVPCSKVGSDLSFKVCVEYRNAKYEFRLNYYPTPADYYWLADLNTFAAISGGTCIPISDDFALKNICAEHQGVSYGFTMNFLSPPGVPFGYFWKMNMTTFQKK